MATFYYVNAIGPASFSVAGKTFQLKPGQSKGPFNDNELVQIKRSFDASRLHIHAVEEADKSSLPEVSPINSQDPVEDLKDNSPIVDEQYKGVTNQSSPHQFNDPFVENAKEPLNLIPNNNNPNQPYNGQGSIKVEEIIPTRPVILEPPIPPLNSSSTEVLATYPIQPPVPPANQPPQQPNPFQVPQTTEPPRETPPIEPDLTLLTPLPNLPGATIQTEEDSIDLTNIKSSRRSRPPGNGSSTPPISA